MKQLFRKPL